MVNNIDPYTQRERGPSPGLTALRNLGAALRRMKTRRGLAQSQAMIFLGVVGAILILGAGAFGFYRLFIQGSESQALKSNIDRVAQASETFWNQFSADRHGRRKIDLAGFCNYANSQFTTEDQIVLRTLSIADASLAGATAQGDADAVLTDGEADEMLGTARTGAQAHCPTDPASTLAAGQLGVAGASDIVVGGTTLVVGATALASPNVPHAATAAATAPTIASLEDVGLASTQAVWIAQYNGWTAGAQVPAGTATSNGTDNEVLVFGGVAPSGESYCLVKVFNANDRSTIGEYRVGKQAGTGANHLFAVCSRGIAETGVSHNAGWPEAR